jgi:hypothetical protein
MFNAGLFHIALITWATPEQRRTWTDLAGDTNVFDLFTLPISYLAVDGLNINFAPDGFPLASR